MKGEQYQAIIKGAISYERLPYFPSKEPNDCSSGDLPSYLQPAEIDVGNRAAIEQPAGSASTVCLAMLKDIGL